MMQSSSSETALDRFSERNSRYMEKYFPGWENRGSYITPPIPYSDYPEPRERRALDQARRADRDYTDMRMYQKPEIDKDTVYRRLAKFAVENCRMMFIFHTIKFAVDQQEAFLDTFGPDAVKQGIDKLRSKKILKNILLRNGNLKHLEVDFLVVDEKVGLLVIEVKGKHYRKKYFECSDESGCNINKARKQLQKDSEFLRLIGYLSKNGQNLTNWITWENMPITKVVALVDDTGQAYTDSDILVVFRNQLESATTFQKWWDDNIVWRGNNVAQCDDVGPNAIYKHMVPVLVGLSAAFKAPGMRSVDNLLGRHDEQIACQDLSSQPNPMELLINVHKNKVELNDFVLKYLTSDQKKCLDSDKVCIIEGAAGTGKTWVMMLKLLQVARQEWQTLLLCNGPFVEEYYEFLTKNRIDAKVYRSLDGKVNDLLSWNGGKISVKYQTHPFKERCCQVVLCDLEQFVSALSKRWSHLFTREWQPPWNQTLSVFIDDADLNIFLKHKWSGLLLDMNRDKAANEYHTWITLAHTQTVSAYDPSAAEKHNDLLTQLRSRVSELRGKWHKLEKVLRNSVEIMELNKQVAKYISTFHDVQNVPMPAVGHSTVSGPIQLMELYGDKLYDAKCWRAAVNGVERECDKALAKFLEFILTNIVLPNANRGRTAVLTVGEASFATTFHSQLKNHPNFERLNNLLVYTDHCKNFRELKLDDPGNTKSFEWEQVVVVIVPSSLSPDSPLEVLQSQEEQRSEFWCKLYQATTRARMRLYFVGPPVVWDVFLKPLGVYELYFLRRWFRNLPNSDSYEQVAPEELFRLNELNALKEELEEKYKVSGPVQLMELDDATFQITNAREVELWEALTKFVMFLLDKREYVTNVDSSRTAVLTVGNAKNIFWSNLDVLQKELFVDAGCQTDLKALLTYLNPLSLTTASMSASPMASTTASPMAPTMTSTTFSAAALTIAPTTASTQPSFKWESLLVLIPPQVTLLPGLTEEEQPLFWQQLYEAQTKARTRRFLVGPSDVWKLVNRGLSKQFVQLHCFKTDDRVPGSYKKRLKNEQAIPTMLNHAIPGSSSSIEGAQMEASPLSVERQGPTDRTCGDQKPFWCLKRPLKSQFAIQRSNTDVANKLPKTEGQPPPAVSRGGAQP